MRAAPQEFAVIYDTSRPKLHSAYQSFLSIYQKGTPHSFEAPAIGGAGTAHAISEGRRERRKGKAQIEKPDANAIVREFDVIECRKHRDPAKIGEHLLVPRVTSKLRLRCRFADTLVPFPGCR